MADFTIDDIQKTAQDAFYVTVGLGVIAFQRAQVQRRELHKRFEQNVAGTQQSLGDSVKTIEERLEAVETRIDAVLDDVAERLPDQARVVLDQARTVAKDTRAQLRQMIGQR